MQETYTEAIGKVLKNKSRIEKELNVKIENKGKLVFVNGDGEKEYLALKVLEALGLGFSIEKALLLKNEEIILQTINIKSLTKRKDIERIRARIIGTRGKTICNLKKLSECEICLHDNQIGIIGDFEFIEEAMTALESLVHGSKQANVYSRLEREGKKRRINPDFQTPLKNELKNKRVST
jgi:KH domain-containing protein